jgi:arsenate reductase
MNASTNTRPLHILILCTGNSARSLLGEALLNHYAAGQWQAHSAGSQPKGVPHPLALQTLQAHHIEIAGLRSKSWNEFAAPGAPSLDIVITVCDNAAHEMCPIWQGAPITVHWGIPDPAAVTGSEAEQRAAFEQAYQTLSTRILRLTPLTLNELNATQLQGELRALAAVY